MRSSIRKNEELYVALINASNPYAASALPTPAPKDVVTELLEEHDDIDLFMGVLED